MPIRWTFFSTGSSTAAAAVARYARAVRGDRLAARVAGQPCLANNRLFCRYDDGEVTHNIEATAFGRGGFRSHPDEYYREQYRISETAVSCGSDLRAVTAREMLGLFIAIRAMHFAILRQMREAEAGLLLARSLFPHNRLLYGSQMEASIQCGLRLFDWGEGGHPANVGRNLRERLHAANFGNTCTIVTTETNYA